MQAKFFAAGFDGYAAHQKALGALYGVIQQQAALLTYADNFRLLGYLALACMPLAFFFHRLSRQAQSKPEIVGE